VLESDQDRLTPCPADERARSDLEELEPALVRRRVGAGTARRPGEIVDAHPVQHHRRRRGQGLTVLGRDESVVDLAPGPVLRRAPGGVAGAQGDPEAEGAGFADRRLDEAGLPDARLTADQEDATPAAPGVREAGAQRAELGLAPDERDVAHAR